MKALSSGVVIVCGSKVLLGHSTGNRHWDIAKGMVDAGETPLEAALRELKEEFGIQKNPLELKDLGLFLYNPKKDLHLFKLELKSFVPIDSLKCTSFFKHYKTQKELPEIDKYQWVEQKDISVYCVPNMVVVLEQVFSKRE